MSLVKYTRRQYKFYSDSGEISYDICGTLVKSRI